MSRRTLYTLSFCVILFVGSCKKDKGGTIGVPENSSNSIHTQTVQSQPTDTILPNNIAKEGLEIGDIAWDLNLQDSNGVFVKLSSLRGKIVLLDFWASWCAPCKFQNRHLKEVYPKYKDSTYLKAKGFEIYMVSVWDKKDPWVQRMRTEKYNWKYNLLDEGGAAEWRYNIKSIPANFLIDQNGIIVAKDLRDSLVEKALIKLLK